MESIRAFVGYSFRDADSEVLAPILKYISRLAELVPNFSWQHAEHPEPRMVDEKVLELFADKNLYIGICTARERVIADEALTTQWWAPGKLNSSKSNFVWKTSDWIIQEIGVALGRDMHVILLIEEDTRVPGALQGNLEHVSFNRKSPEKCFDRLSGMIAALSPKVSNIQGTTKELPAAADQSPEKSRQPDNGDESFTPKADWKKRDYNFTLFNAIAYGTDQQVQNIQESFLASPFGGSEIDQKRWAAYGHFCRIITGKDGRLLN